MDDFQFVEIYDAPGPEVKKWRFTTIYKEAAIDGRTLLWTIGFDGVELIMIHGLEGGAMQTNRREVVPKAGRTLNEQAHQEARRRFIDKLGEGYQTCETTQIEVVRSKAMLANKYVPGKTRLRFPIVGQAKIDGIRMLVSGGGTSLFCMSREGHEFYGLEHIKKELRNLVKYFPSDCILDGEVFTSELTFNEISGIIRKKKVIDPRERLLKYYMFDLNTNDDKPFEDRYSILYRGMQAYLKDLHDETERLIAENPMVDPSMIDFDNEYGSKNLRILRCYPIENEDEIQSIYKYLVEERFEGIILRKLGGSRSSKELKESMYIARSSHVSNILKYKGDRESEEVEIIGAKGGIGQEKDLVIWEVRDVRGNEFSVRPKGSFEERRNYLLNYQQYIGKPLTIEYQELSEYGVPRFPVGIEIRDYE